MARKPAALARELLRNFPKGRRGSKRRRRKPGTGSNGARPKGELATETPDDEALETLQEDEALDTEAKADDNVEDLDLDHDDDDEQDAEAAA
jgi:hypothetical protein